MLVLGAAVTSAACMLLLTVSTRARVSGFIGSISPGASALPRWLGGAARPRAAAIASILPGDPLDRVVPRVVDVEAETLGSADDPCPCAGVLVVRGRPTAVTDPGDLGWLEKDHGQGPPRPRNSAASRWLRRLVVIVVDRVTTEPLGCGP